MEKIISKNVITAIPGIGAKYAKRLDAVGIKKVNIFIRFTLYLFFFEQSI